MGTCYCERGDRILDAGCDYESGKFLLRGLPECLPRLFTARFRAPADFAEDNAVAILGNVLDVKTVGMEAGPKGLFRTGAIVRCDVDLDRGLVFFGQTGSAESCGCPDMEFQIGDINCYIDLLGDDSLANSGAKDSPFKTLAGARNAICRRIVLTPLGSLTFLFNPGTYELNDADRNVIRAMNHPQNVGFAAADPANKPLLISDHFTSYWRHRSYTNVRLASATVDVNVLCAHRNAAITLDGVEVIAQGKVRSLVYAHTGGAVYPTRSLTLDGNGYDIPYPLGCYQAHIAYFGPPALLITVKNIPSVTTFAHCDGGNILLTGSSITGTTSGKRYNVIREGMHAQIVSTLTLTNNRTTTINTPSMPLYHGDPNVAKYMLEAAEAIETVMCETKAFLGGRRATGNLFAKLDD